MDIKTLRPPCMARARRARAGLTVYSPSRTLEPLAFDEYCRFYSSAFFWEIKRGPMTGRKSMHGARAAAARGFP